MTTVPSAFYISTFIEIIISLWLAFCWVYLMKVYMEGVREEEISICIGFGVAVVFWIVLGVIPATILWSVMHLLGY